MSTSIDQAFIRQYESEVHHIFQREGGILRGAVRTKDNVRGTSTTFQKVGKGTASTKARHGVVTPMNMDHTPVVCTLYDFYAGDYVDKLDEAKTNIDERMVIAKGGATALGRKVDDQIITALDGTSQTTVTWGLGSAAAIENSLLNMSKAADANDIPNDGMRYAALTPTAFAMAMKVESFASADYVGSDGLPFREGAPVLSWKRWMGILWTMHTGLTGVGTSSAKVFLWHKNAVGYATGAHSQNKAQDPSSAVAADITWEGPRVAHWVNHYMSGGAVLIDDAGVIEGSINDTTALPTS